MRWKSTLDSVIDAIGPPEARFALSKTDPETTREKYVEYIGNAKRSVKIVVGEANGKLFNRPSMGNALKSVLSSSENSIVDFVFHKYNNVDIAKESFLADNKEIAAVKRQFPKRTHIYWSPIRPRQHYAVLDEGEQVILEEPNHKGFEPFWAAVMLDQGRGTVWMNRFDEYIKYCRELTFDSPD